MGKQITAEFPTEYDGRVEVDCDVDEIKITEVRCWFADVEVRFAGFDTEACVYGVGREGEDVVRVLRGDEAHEVYERAIESIRDTDEWIVDAILRLWQ